jgi:hypothetical protein
MGHRYEVRIDGDLAELHELEDDALNDLLRQVHTARPKPAITCACRDRDPPLRLVVFNRGNGYFLRRHADDSGDDHHQDCRHHTPSEQRMAESGYTTDAFKVGEGGDIRVALDFGLTLSDSTPSATPVLKKDSDGRERAVRSRATLLGLLHLLWEQAGLTRFDGGVPPHWSPWRQLAHAAARVHPNSMRSLAEHGLLDLLLLPARSADFQKAANYKRMAEAFGKRRVLFLCLITKELLEQRSARGSIQLQAELGVTLYVPGEMADSCVASSRGEAIALRNGSHVAAFGIAKVYKRENGSFGASAERMAMMQTTSHCIPVASLYERRLAEHLEAGGRVFTKPLRYDATDDVHPDFVLLDTGAETPLEVYGMTAADYRARKEQKVDFYAKRYPGRHWAWDATSEPFEHAVATLPAKGQR